jgi:uncharacterized membrane protein YdjX (TVP38/TMEM64 family)
MSQRHRQLWIKGAVLTFLVVLLLVLGRYGPQPADILGSWVGEEWENLEEIYSSRERLRAFLLVLGPHSSAIFVLLQAFQVVLSPIPGELTGIVGGYVYGTTFGFILSSIGLALGSWIAFELARIFGKPFVERWVSQEILKKFDFLSTNAGTALCFFLFLVPGLPKDYLCYLLGLSPMRLATFLLISAVGRMPGTYMLTLQGATIRNQDYTWAVAIAVVAVIAFFLAYVYRAPLFEWIRKKGAGRSMDIPR